MRAILRAPRSLLDLADAQAGALSREQCLLAGLSDPAIAQRLAEGWRLVTRGVYSTVPITWSTCAWAGVLLGGARACLGGESALHLLGVGDQPEAIEVWSPRQLGPRDDLIHPLRFTRGVRPATGTLPRSRVEPALLDAAAVAGTDAGDVVSWVTAAYRLRATTPHRLGAALAQRVRQPHRRLLQELTQTRNAGVHSPLEWRFLRTIVRAHRLPEPRLQAALSSGTRSDALFEDFGVVVELDGRTGHADGVFRDLWRDNTHAVRAHVLTLRYGWHDCVASPCLVARQVAQALGDRGWPGPLHRCRACRLLSPTQW